MSINLRNCIFGFKCNQKWETLNATSVNGIKFCDDCQREVHLVEDLRSLEEAIILNRCVAISTLSDKNEIVREVTVGMVEAFDFDEPAYKRSKNNE